MRHDGVVSLRDISRHEQIDLLPQQLTSRVPKQPFERRIRVGDEALSICEQNTIGKRVENAVAVTAGECGRSRGSGSDRRGGAGRGGGRSSAERTGGVRVGRRR